MTQQWACVPINSIYSIMHVVFFSHFFRNLTVHWRVASFYVRSSESVARLSLNSGVRSSVWATARREEIERSREYFSESLAESGGRREGKHTFASSRSFSLRLEILWGEKQRDAARILLTCFVTNSWIHSVLWWGLWVSCVRPVSRLFSVLQYEQGHLLQPQVSAFEKTHTFSCFIAQLCVKLLWSHVINPKSLRKC